MNEFLGDVVEGDKVNFMVSSRATGPAIRGVRVEGYCLEDTKKSHTRGHSYGFSDRLDGDPVFYIRLSDDGVVLSGSTEEDREAISYFVLIRGVDEQGRKRRKR